jgi:hypothetical protein
VAAARLAHCAGANVEGDKNVQVAGVDNGGFKPGALHQMTCSLPSVANQRKRALTLQLIGRACGDFLF